PRAVDEVVVHERRHVHHLDRDAGGDRRLAGRGEEAEQRPEPLAAGAERLAGDLAGEPGVRGDRASEPRLDLGHVRRDARCAVDLLELAAHDATPVWSATIVPPRSLNCTPSKPHPRSRAASASAFGNRFTDAGRYV